MGVWTYSQRTGLLTSPDDGVVEYGYAGAPPYVNVARAEWQEDLGPLPTGNYTIGAAYDHPNLGPASMPLEPDPGNTMYGRTGFYMHGDSPSMDQTASQGCIIMSRATRDLVDASACRELIVTV